MVPCTNVQDGQYDGVVVVTDRVDKLTGGLAVLRPSLEQRSKVDAACEDEVALVYCPDLPSNRLVRPLQSKATLKKKFVSYPPGGHNCGQSGGRKFNFF